MLLGLSRKSSIFKTLGITAAEALNGTTVMNTIGLLNGANILRVHDVKKQWKPLNSLGNIARKDWIYCFGFPAFCMLVLSLPGSVKDCSTSVRRNKRRYKSPGPATKIHSLFAFRPISLSCSPIITAMKFLHLNLDFPRSPIFLISFGNMSCCLFLILFSTILINNLKTCFLMLTHTLSQKAAYYS